MKLHTLKRFFTLNTVLLLLTFSSQAGLMITNFSYNKPTFKRSIIGSGIGLTVPLVFGVVTGQFSIPFIIVGPILGEGNVEAPELAVPEELNFLGDKTLTAIYRYQIEKIVNNDPSPIEIYVMEEILDQGDYSELEKQYVLEFMAKHQIN
jgi:hypothetical protein